MYLSISTNTFESTSLQVQVQMLQLIGIINLEVLGSAYYLDSVICQTVL